MKGAGELGYAFALKVHKCSFFIPKILQFYSIFGIETAYNQISRTKISIVEKHLISQYKSFRILTPYMYANRESGSQIKMAISAAISVTEWIQAGFIVKEYFKS